MNAAQRDADHFHQGVGFLAQARASDDATTRRASGASGGCVTHCQTLIPHTTERVPLSASGSLAQHAKITRMFERSLQAIDGALTVPYWDPTIEDAQVMMDAWWW